MNKKYFEETRMQIFACVATYNGDCGYHIIDEDDPNCIVLTVPAENSIRGTIEVKIKITESGMDVMWYYPTVALKADEDMSEEEKYRIATDLTVAFNNFSDKTDDLVEHTFCINREDGDIYWHTFYNRMLFFPYSKEGTLEVLKDVIYLQPKRLERICFPIFAALIGKISAEKANDMIEKIRKE